MAEVAEAAEALLGGVIRKRVDLAGVRISQKYVKAKHGRGECVWGRLSPTAAAETAVIAAPKTTAGADGAAAADAAARRPQDQHILQSHHQTLCLL
ncbi:unnamed protein product [Closterium sp. NIES-54]